MLSTTFIVVSSIATFVSFAIMYIKGAKPRTLIPLGIVGLCAPVLAGIEQVLFDQLFVMPVSLIFPLYCSVSCLFLGATIEAAYSLKTIAGDRYAWLWRALCAIGIVGVWFCAAPMPAIHDGAPTIVISASLHYFFACRLILTLGLLYTFENLYRFAKPHQRRLGRISFLSLGILTIFDLVISMRSLLFSTITSPYLDAATIIRGICVPVAFFGFLRYRMNEDRIVFSPTSIYTSLTMVFAGTLFLTLGVTVAVVQHFGAGFGFFEQFLGLFAVIIFSVLIGSSAPARFRLKRFVNRHIYRTTHDYREQFFRLHQTYMAGEQLVDSVNVLLENLNTHLAIGEAFVFIYSQSDGCFHLHIHPESLIRKPYTIQGDSSLVSLFENSKDPCILLGPNRTTSYAQEKARQEALVDALKIAAVFPIMHKNTLFGLLMIRNIRTPVFDDENIDLVNVFTISLGNVFFKYHVLQQYLESRQFESFHHISSFVIHDIKNQAATLNLVLKNAEKNIANPDFQKSLLHSLGNCTQALQTLVARLSTARSSGGELKTSLQEVNTVVSKALGGSGVENSEGITVSSTLAATGAVQIDPMAMETVLRNLFNNAVDAMAGGGTLTVITGDIATMPAANKTRFGITPKMSADTAIYIMVTDTGVGMSAKFVAEKLFRPFTTTKDKGIGIGLYQSKILIEQMRGRLLCRSTPHKGTEFCIII
jgi:putative PEP-CTERM system histidine kinase